LDNQQSIQSGRVARRQAGRDLFVDLHMDLDTQVVCQSLKRAEGWQVNCGFAQRFNCPVYQVRWITHRASRFDHGCYHQLLTFLG
jgi:hypothetical protein